MPRADWLGACSHVGRQSEPPLEVVGLPRKAEWKLEPLRLVWQRGDTRRVIVTLSQVIFTLLQALAGRAARSGGAPAGRRRLGWPLGDALQQFQHSGEIGDVRRLWEAAGRRCIAAKENSARVISTA